MSKKVLLFSTRFLEQKQMLFCNDNYKLLDCQSPKYRKFFLSSALPLELVHYFNNLYCKKFFSKYEDKKGYPIVLNDDNYVELGERIWGRIPGEFDKDDWDGFFSDLGKLSRLYSIVIKTEGSKSVLDTPDRTIEGNEDDLGESIKRIENASFNKGIALNTDFGGAIDKISIDRRFKIYKLNQGDLKEIHAYGVWCLKNASNETEWYKALYEELKTQMGNDFSSVSEILYFLHDGDIGEKKPFDVKYYKVDKETFDFLDKGKSLSVAIFQHSLSSIASILSNTNINSAIKAALTEMEKGGQKACLYKLSDFLASYKGKADDTELKKLLDVAKKLFAKENENNDDEAFLKCCYQLSNSEEKEDVFYDANHDINELLRKLHNK